MEAKADRHGVASQLSALSPELATRLPALPAKAGIQSDLFLVWGWTPACAGVTFRRPRRRGRPASLPHLLQRGAGAAADDEVADLGHVLHREAHAFAAEAGILDAAIGHVVDPVGRHVVDDDAADVEPVPGLEHPEQIAGEQAGLEAELAVVDLVEGGAEILEFGQDRDRAERLLAIDIAAAVDVLEQGRLEHRPFPFAAAEQFRARGRRLPDPGVEPARLAFADHRADERVAIL